MRALPALALVLLAMAPALAACEGGDPVDSAIREAAARNHAEATRTTAENDASRRDPAAAGPTAADQAFAASETEMRRLMAGASGETIDEAYIARMVAHHQGAMAMAEVALRESRDPEIRRMARSVIDARTGEIAEMRAWKPQAE
jgi:uncharacterized protein (DUF305 family)